MVTPKRRLTPTSLAIKRLTVKTAKDNPMEVLGSVIKGKIAMGKPKTKYYDTLNKYLISRKYVEKEIIEFIKNRTDDRKTSREIIDFYHKKLKTKDKQKVIVHLFKIKENIGILAKDIDKLLHPKSKSFSDTYFEETNLIHNIEHIIIIERAIDHAMMIAIESIAGNPADAKDSLIQLERSTELFLN